MKKILTGVIIILVVTIVYLYTLVFMPKFKDVTVSTGSNTINVDDFLRLNIFKKKAKLVTNVDSLNLDNVGKKDVVISFDGNDYVVTVNVIDDVKPDLKVKDISRTLNYKINVDDFVESIFDHSDYSLTVDDSLVDYTKYGDYRVFVKAKDSYGNETVKTATLSLKLLYESINHELGTPLKVEEFLVNKSDVNKISSSNINQINYKVAGSYKFICRIGDKAYNSEVIIKDTKAPVIVTKDLKYIKGKSKKYTMDDLLVSITDASQYTVTKTGTIDLTKNGDYKVTFTAVDSYGNKSSKTATLSVKTEFNPPKFKGLTTITSERGKKIDYRTGVSAIDKADGAVEFNYDDSKVNINKEGTYKVTYTAKDKSGNTAKGSRTVIITHSQEDTNKLLQQFYDKYLKGHTVLEMTNIIRSKISYRKVRGDDPVYYGLTEMAGSCYVHAILLKRSLDLAGIKNVFVESNSKTHFWVLVYQDGKWRHYDPTPGSHNPGPMTDKERAKYQTGVGAVKWDREKYPKAE